MGARPSEPEPGAEWDQRRLQADHDLERTLEQERLRQVLRPYLSQPSVAPASPSDMLFNQQGAAKVSSEILVVGCELMFGLLCHHIVSVSHAECRREVAVGHEGKLLWCGVCLTLIVGQGSRPVRAHNQSFVLVTCLFRYIH